MTVIILLEQPLHKRDHNMSEITPPLIIHQNNTDSSFEGRKHPSKQAQRLKRCYFFEEVKNSLSLFSMRLFCT